MKFGIKSFNFTIHFFLKMSERRGSNPPPIAWKAIALPNELLSLKLISKLIASQLKHCGGGWIRTTEGILQQSYSLPHLATLVHPLNIVSLYNRFCLTVCKITSIFYSCKLEMKKKLKKNIFFYSKQSYTLKMRHLYLLKKLQKNILNFTL